MTKDQFLKKAREAGLDTDILGVAFDFSKKAHRGQKRRSGVPFFSHPESVAVILVDWNLDTETVAAGLLHDVLEDTNETADSIRDSFGKTVFSLVDGVTMLKGSDLRKLAEPEEKKHDLETLRKLFLATAEDIRVVFIKFADRLHNMRTLSYLSKEKQKRIAKETLDIYAPLAGRLGMGKLKAELEDLAFKYYLPKECKRTEEIISSELNQAKRYLPRITRELHKLMIQNNIECSIDGRVKQLYSTYKKLKKVGGDVDKIYDILAVRIIVSDIDDCYKSLGLIHGKFKPLIYRIKDYIAVPKPNGYRSLHTTVFGIDGRITEIQIRTEKMHEEAENGIASHWKYSESKEHIFKTGGVAEAKKEEIRLIEDLRKIFASGGSLDEFNRDLFADRIFAVSPRGDIFELPEGSTPLDFAFAVHTKLGERCIGAKVNGRMVPLSYKLENRDMVDIITSNHAPGPNRDWLYLTVTQKAKQKIRNFLRQKNKDRNIEIGKSLLEEELKISGGKMESITKSDWTQLLNKMPQTTLDDLYASIGEGVNSPSLILKKLGAKDGEVKIRVKKRPLVPQPKGTIGVEGKTDYLFYLSPCCNPRKGQEIIGYVTRGKGIGVHTIACPNLAGLKKERFIEVAWESHTRTKKVSFQVLVEDRKGLLREITGMIADMNLNIADLRTGFDRPVPTVEFSVDVDSAYGKRMIRENLKSIKGIVEVKEAG